MQQLTIHCRNLKCSLNKRDDYYTIPTTRDYPTLPQPHVNPTPKHCIVCSAPVTHTPYNDTLDEIVQAYGLYGISTRAKALALLTKLHDYNAQRVANHRASPKWHHNKPDPKPHTLEEMLVASDYPIPAITTGFTPLTMHCLDCGATMRVLRGTPLPHHGTPKYCTWCASKHITVTQTNEEDAYWETLATAYNIPIAVLTKVYGVWASRNTPHATLREYIEANQDRVDALVMMYEIRQEQAQQAAQQEVTSNA